MKVIDHAFSVHGHRFQPGFVCYVQDSSVFGAYRAGDALYVEWTNGHIPHLGDYLVSVDGREDLYQLDLDLRRNRLHLRSHRTGDEFAVERSDDGRPAADNVKVIARVALHRATL